MRLPWLLWQRMPCMSNTIVQCLLLGPSPHRRRCHLAIGFFQQLSKQILWLRCDGSERNFIGNVAVVKHREVVLYNGVQFGLLQFLFFVWTFSVVLFLPLNFRRQCHAGMKTVNGSLHIVAVLRYFARRPEKIPLLAVRVEMRPALWIRRPDARCI